MERPTAVPIPVRPGLTMLPCLFLQLDGLLFACLCDQTYAAMAISVHTIVNMIYRPIATVMHWCMRTSGQLTPFYYQIFVFEFLFVIMMI